MPAKKPSKPVQKKTPPYRKAPKAPGFGRALAQHEAARNKLEAARSLLSSLGREHNRFIPSSPNRREQRQATKAEVDRIRAEVEKWSEQVDRTRKKLKEFE